MVTGEPGPITVCCLQCFVVTSTPKLNLSVRERGRGRNGGNWWRRRNPCTKWQNFSNTDLNEWKRSQTFPPHPWVLRAPESEARCQTLAQAALSFARFQTVDTCSQAFTFCDLLPPAVGLEASAWFSLWILDGDGVNFWAARRGLVLVAMVVLRRT